eukprot:6193086-Pleurochrysis_carterae.AAC.1
MTDCLQMLQNNTTTDPTVKCTRYSDKCQGTVSEFCALRAEMPRPPLPRRSQSAKKFSYLEPTLVLLRQRLSPIQRQGGINGISHRKYCQYFL